ADSIQAARDAHSEFVEAGDEHRKFYQLPVFKRIIIMFGGPFMNLFLGLVLTLTALVGIGTYTRSTTVVEVSQCVPSSFTQQIACTDEDEVGPAKIAGLQAGDVVLAVNGKSVRNWDEITEFAKSNPGELSLSVKRATETIDLQITPALVSRPIANSSNPTAEQVVPFFGVVLEPIRQAQTLDKAFAYSGEVIVSTFSLIATLPVQVYELVSNTISGEQRNSSGPISIIGVGQAAGEIASDSSATLLDKLGSGLMMLASLNFALFAFNMIPLLPLDGGHIAGAIYEAIKKAVWRLRGKPNPGPADTALMMPLTYVVSGLLIVLSLILLLVDLINPVSLGL
ncbi:MAG: hypothetical protein RL149_707, partial [Actinomycetota bacterium]